MSTPSSLSHPKLDVTADASYIRLDHAYGRTHEFTSILQNNSLPERTTLPAQEGFESLLPRLSFNSIDDRQGLEAANTALIALQRSPTKGGARRKGVRRFHGIGLLIKASLEKIVMPGTAHQRMRLDEALAFGFHAHGQGPSLSIG